MGCGASTGHFAEQSYAKFKADGEEMQGWDPPVVVVVGPVGSIFNHVFLGWVKAVRGWRSIFPNYLDVSRRVPEFRSIAIFLWCSISRCSIRCGLKCMMDHLGGIRV